MIQGTWLAFIQYALERELFVLPGINKTAAYNKIRNVF